MNKILMAVFLMAVVTYFTRMLPIVLFRNKLNSQFIRSFLYYTPFAVLGAMTFPSILYSTGNLFTAIIGLGVALLLAYFEQGLMKVALGAILAVFLLELWL
ncbi:MAG TPA: AzlD domain-containing protein [Clostridia bacterium]|jgi:branched-subunit amino acid transport protein|nr:AzlD domain-containing protein [Clostridia bacterium]